MRFLFGFVGLGNAALVALSYFGELHPAADSFAVVRVPMVIVFIVCALAANLGQRPTRTIGTTGRWFLRVSVILIAFLLTVPVFAPRLLIDMPTDSDFVLYQQNLSFSGVEQGEWLAAMTALSPDMITLQEVSSRQQPLIDALKVSHPTLIRCDFHSRIDVAVLSRFPAVEGSGVCADDDGMAAVQLETPHGPVWLVSIHLLWPWPYGQAAQVDRLISALGALDGHVIIGGDFNQVTWSHTIERIARASGTALVGPYAPTYHVGGVPIGIDHVFTSLADGQGVRVMPKLGSDHHGLVAYLTRPNAP